MAQASAASSAHCDHHSQNYYTSSQSSLIPHRHYSDLGDCKLDAFAIPNNEQTPLTAQALHRVAHDIHEFGILKERLQWFLVYTVSILLFVGLNGALLVANGKDQTYIEEHYETLFHSLSFWGVFVFTLVEATTLLISTGVASSTTAEYPGTSSSTGSCNPNQNSSWSVQDVASSYCAIMILVDVVFSFFSAILYTLDPETFEVPAHYVEYLVQVPISCINLIFASRNDSTESRVPPCEPEVSEPLVKNSHTDKLQQAQNNSFKVVPLLVVSTSVGALVQLSYYLPVVLSLLQLFLYSGAIPTRWGSERSAHTLEFLNEIFNGCFALRYALHNYRLYKEQLDQHRI